ncbi:hypothetical protein PROFUN_08309 [Planoprotostelium fungivorum]|uniref:Uncharacterized protein n=1 Tax=Planoprotostelium fungivorum TaxID=1890364 RepID=A0A2P6NK35_9EUKA|nr:hypothetical protein PROFUN_08309 [Planoprotostelium fungivorum]
MSASITKDLLNRLNGVQKKKTKKKSKNAGPKESLLEVKRREKEANYLKQNLKVLHALDEVKDKNVIVAVKETRQKKMKKNVEANSLSFIKGNVFDTTRKVLTIDLDAQREQFEEEGGEKEEEE